MCVARPDERRSGDAGKVIIEVGALDLVHEHTQTHKDQFDHWPRVRSTRIAFTAGRVLQVLLLSTPNLAFYCKQTDSCN